MKHFYEPVSLARHTCSEAGPDKGRTLKMENDFLTPKAKNTATTHSDTEPTAKEADTTLEHRTKN